MILYRLICENNHDFEVWFQNGQSCDHQLQNGQVECPVCASHAVQKALMAPNVVSSRARENRREKALGTIENTPARAALPSNAAAPHFPPDKKAAAPGSTANLLAEPGPPGGKVSSEDLRKVIEEARSFIEKTCENVGDEFAREARSIHYGESENRPIYGTTTAREAHELHDEGIDFSILPWRSRQNMN